eukprot:3552136-Amphidinium_carterae.3
MHDLGYGRAQQQRGTSFGALNARRNCICATPGSLLEAAAHGQMVLESLVAHDHVAVLYRPMVFTAGRILKLLTEAVQGQWAL